MALINCPECSSQVSDKAPSCPTCGVPILVESKVCVYGYTQQFLINPKVEVFWEGKSMGKVAKGEMLEFDIQNDGVVEFKCKPRGAQSEVKAGRINRIKLSWDRITGKMIPQVVDQVAPDSAG